MAKYSKLNAKNIVTQMIETDENLSFVEANYGGLWIEYEQNGTFGERGKKYSLEYDIFIEASKPVDHGRNICNSWTLNTTTGLYEPPIINVPRPITQEEDTQGLSWHWEENLYQADNTKGWSLKNGPDLREDHGICYDENGNPYDCRHWL